MTTSRTDDALTVAERVDRARSAQERIATVDQQRADELARAAAWALYRDAAAREVAELAVERTGVGAVEDKVFKTKRQLLGALDDLRDAPSVGVLSRGDGLVEVAEPVGVVGALTPATNPVATVPHLATLALKGRNAIVVSPAPGTGPACRRAVEHVREQLERIDAPPDLVQAVDGRGTRDTVEALASAADFVQATSSQSVVDIAQRSGTPNHGVAVGNVVVVVDETVDAATAAERLAASTVLDHGATCVNANVAVLHDAVATGVLDALVADGGYRCSPGETEAVADHLFSASGALDRSSVGSSATDIADAAGIDVPPETRFLLVDGDGLAPDHPLFGEKLSPVVTTRTVDGFGDGLELADAILTHEGRGHSCAVYTDSNRRVRSAAERLPVGRLLVNQSSIALAGGESNAVPFTLSLGGGTWAGNQSDGNLSYREFLDVTTVVRPRSEPVDDPETLFEGYPAGDETRPFYSRN
ncbi:aldehyde dehydrogenase family protein [Halomicrobium salinisoli]|uniref:aldehyde dehydrogenase family protein n=1 Tax=Halomicrobium salinisoli TaxID=2878391 RepID=UPI001CF06F25|nr:aldehyde dehydrogenase family protein [Halomicrobium salinisoli]